MPKPVSIHFSREYGYYLSVEGSVWMFGVLSTSVQSFEVFRRICCLIENMFRFMNLDFNSEKAVHIITEVLMALELL